MQQSKADSLMFTVYRSTPSSRQPRQREHEILGRLPVKNIANGKPVILGEVGWPSAGKPDNGAAITSVANEQRYVTDMINAAKDGQVGSTFLFEAFDEPWKGNSQWEPHWGLWDQNGNPKFPIPWGL